ncbi:MAG: hypothetical protein ACKN9S_05990 [Pirellula sp.]
MFGKTIDQGRVFECFHASNMKVLARSFQPESLRAIRLKTELTGWIQGGALEAHRPRWSFQEPKRWA